MRIRMKSTSMAYLLVIASWFIGLEAIPQRLIVSSTASEPNTNETIGPELGCEYFIMITMIMIA